MLNGGYKTVFLLALCALIPIVGPLFMLGGALEHGRRVAWGSNEGPVKAGPTKEGIGMKTCLASGWKAFVVDLGWVAVIAIAKALLLNIPGLGDSEVFNSILNVLEAILCFVVAVAMLRATIYQHIAPGYRVSTIWSMIKHDPAGLLRLFGMRVLMMAVVALTVILILAGAFASVWPWILELVYIASVGYASDYYLLYLIAQMIQALFLPLLAVILLGIFLVSIVCCIMFTGFGLWMRQFNVPAWGSDKDPLPSFVNETSDSNQNGLVGLPMTTSEGSQSPDAPVANQTDEPIGTPQPQAPVAHEKDEPAAAEGQTQTEPAPQAGSDTQRVSEMTAAAAATPDVSTSAQPEPQDQVSSSEETSSNDEESAELDPIAVDPIEAPEEIEPEDLGAKKDGGAQDSAQE
ncbi:MAG: DUF4013 domain-containing protein [Tractidigestivibacter sp.]|uniref:DUF4013 domain-containing protein n=1 Tax=Tractidigestivibacter sp. TaxID=2847320 RepID=UPI003D8FE28C